MSISVVIPALVSDDKKLCLTAKCLESAKQTSLDHETIIVETCTDYFKDSCDVHIYEKEKTTATKSINRGLRAANKKYVVLLTNDVILSPGWLECLLDCFTKHPDCGLSTLATTQFNHVKQDKISEGIWFSVAMFKHQDAYFDENFVNSWDDTDFIMRHYLKGLKMYRNYNCVVDHTPRS